MQVKIIHWPAESAVREHYQAMGIPRLLLVEGGAAAPMCVDLLEDWVRPSISEEDLRMRAATLQARARSRNAPLVDDEGILRHAGRWLALSPLEARLMRSFIQDYCLVVARDALMRRGWSGNRPRRNALDLQILRLRRRIAPLDLAIRTVRARGYVLEPKEAAAGRASSAATRLGLGHWDLNPRRTAQPRSVPSVSDGRASSRAMSS